MKRILFLLSAALIAVSGCGALNIGNKQYIDWFLANADPVLVNVNSDYYTGSIYFSGDLENDFGPNRVLVKDGVKDAKSGNGTATKQYHDITNVYIAYDFFYLYLGMRSPGLPEDDGVDVRFAGASYIFINNGWTTNDTWNSYSNSIWVLDNTGIADRGITGTVGSFEEMGIITTNGNTSTAYLATNQGISLFVKHYRPVERDAHVYNFASGTVEHTTFTASGDSESWPFYGQNSVTEVAIPLRSIFGPNITNIPATFYIAFRVDDATTADAMGLLSDANATAVDWVPDQGKGAAAYDIYLTNWIAVSGF